MPQNSDVASKQWNRYAWCRDNGHSTFVAKADLCEQMFAGNQWADADRALLTAARRPALTINKIISTVGNVLGEQIYNRSEISFRPRNGANAATADALNKVFKQISDNNQLDWKRSDMFADGVITSRGYLDIRMAYDHNNKGVVRYENINPKNVIVDPDGEEYDPDTWSEVFTTKWLTADDIAVLYNREDAEILRNRGASVYPYGYDSVESLRDRFGEQRQPHYGSNFDESSVLRNIRVIDRQYRILDKQRFFVEKETGSTREIPAEFDRNRIALYVDQFGFGVIKKLARRIKWTVTADDIVLHDEWSPYKHFTVVPYFPHFRHGRTIGLVENLTGPQELLNKVTSQELHVLNTTANSGWKIKANSLKNMTMEELEQKGSMTGLVLELAEIDDAEKISANSTPQGLDRMSFKAEESIKTISGISDSMQGNDRADVAAKAIEAKKKAGSTNLVKPLDQLVRTDYFIARNTLDLVQEFYTAPQILTITKDHMTGETEDVHINQVDDETGEVLNDLTLGEFGIVITSVPHRETMEDSQFEQAIALREQGIKIPDDVVIGASRLQKKDEIIKKMADAASTPEAQKAAATQQAGADADVSKTQAEAAQKTADTGLKQAKTREVLTKTQTDAQGPADDGSAAREDAVASHTMDMKEREFAHTQQMDHAGIRMKQNESDAKVALQAKAQADKAVADRAAAAKQAEGGQVNFQPH